MDISNERLNMRRQQPLTDDEVTAIINELMRLRAAHIASITAPKTIPYEDVRVPSGAREGDFMMIDGDTYLITDSPDLPNIDGPQFLLPVK